MALKNIVEKLINDIRSQVGNGKVLLGISGGVDSQVAQLCLARQLAQN